MEKKIFDFDVFVKEASNQFAPIVKQIYLATINANTRWLGEMFGWTVVRTELTLMLGDRLKNIDTLN